MAELITTAAGAQYLRLDRATDYIGTVYCNGCGTGILTPKQRAEIFPLCSHCLVKIEDEA
jgi:hypothetical protein